MNDGYDMKSPWPGDKPTDEEPPESDLRPTSERKTKTEKEKTEKKSDHFDQWESVQAIIYDTHDAGVYTDVFFLYMLQWLSKMQLVGHSNKQA